MTKLLRFLLVSALVVTPAFAQFDTADVLGVIRDASDAVIPGATVTLLNIDTGIQATTTTDEGGNYLFTPVRIGKYTVSAEMPGFAKAVASGVTVTVNARQRVDLKLQVGSVTTTVEVTDAAQILKTESSEQGQLINRVQVVELPLNGRNYSDLALLTAGVARSPNAYGGRYREGSFTVNGLRSAFINYLLDGIDNNAYATSVMGSSNQVTQSSPDSVAEFRVITNNYSAEYGRSGGAAVNVATKSGTNSLHGSLYEFLRNTNLNAVGYVFGPKPSTWGKPTLQQNQFGGSFGGPIVKNTAFYFVDYEGSRTVTKSRGYATLPSMDDRKGIFSVAVTNPLTGKVYPANSGIPLSDMPFYAQKALSQLPIPNGPGRANNYQYLSRGQTYYDKWDAKIDWQINTSMTTFVRFSQRKQLAKSVGLSDVSPLFQGAYTPTLNQQLAAGFTWTMGSGTILEGRFGYSRVDSEGRPTVVGGPSALEAYQITGLPTQKDRTGGFPGSMFNTFATLGRAGASWQWQKPKHYNPKVNFARIMGRHMMKVGYEFVTVHESVFDINPSYGGDYYLGSFSKVPGGSSDLAAYSLADFMFGLRSRYMLSTFNVVKIQRQFHFGYFQDDFRPTNNLTLNLGIRWEFATPWFDPDDHMANFDPTTNTIRYAKPGGSIAERGLVDLRYKNFAPRFGFAYTLNQKTVVRGGYGISYIHEHRVGSAEELNMFGPYGIVAVADQANPLDPSFRTTQMGYPTDMVDPSKFDPLKANITYIPRNVKTAYVQTWVLDVQREVANNLVFDIAYVGNHSLGLPFFADYNQAFPQPTSTSTLSLNERRPIKNFGAITWWNDGGLGYYHGLQAKLERQFTAGFSFINALTYSKSIDNSVQCLDTSNGNYSSPQDVRNMASEKGLSNTDQKLTNVTSIIYQIPIGRGRQFLASAPMLVDKILGGWQFSAINNLLTGMPICLRAWSGTVPALFQTVGNLNDWRGGEAFRPNVLGPVLNTAGGDITENYFNTANVVLPTDPSKPFGNAGRNSVRSSGMFTIDLGISKDFPVFREGTKIQFRAEMFNCLNRTNLSGPNSDRASANWGKIRSTYAPRQVQFALKIVF